MLVTSPLLAMVSPGLAASVSPRRGERRQLYRRRAPELGAGPAPPALSPGAHGAIASCCVPIGSETKDRPSRTWRRSLPPGVAP